MNTTGTVCDLRKDKFSFFSDFYIDIKGNPSCGNATIFQKLVSNWENITADERTACRNFEKSMNRKYKSNHSYHCPSKD